MKRTLRYILFYSSLIGLWALLAKLQVWPPYIFPTPWGVAETLRSGFADHSFWIAIAVSAHRPIVSSGKPRPAVAGTASPIHGSV